MTNDAVTPCILVLTVLRSFYSIRVCILLSLYPAQSVLGAFDIFCSAPLAAVGLVPVPVTVVGAQRSFTSTQQIVYPHSIIADTEYQ
jgi:hypothetical protein